MALSIIAATPDDLLMIEYFIRELAKFEKLESELQLNQAQLKKTLFGNTPFAHVLIAKRNETAVGFALYFFNYSTFLAKPGLYLEDLFVLPEHRSHGVGLKLMKKLMQVALENGCGRMEWSVLDWNQKAIDFYSRLSAKPMSDWTIFRLDEQALIKNVYG